VLGQHRRQIDTLDPVHHQHVTVVFEEVVTSERQTGMGVQRQERPGFEQQTFGFARIGRDASQLERDVATVTPVHGTHQRSFPTAADHGQHLVSAVQQRRRHLGHVTPPPGGRRG
jgi:hypothetical protein